MKSRLPKRRALQLALLALMGFALFCLVFFSSWSNRPSDYWIRQVSWHATGSHELLPGELLDLLAIPKKAFHIPDEELFTLQQRSKEVPLFSSIHLRYLTPNTLHIEYSVREPVARIYNLTEWWGIDALGVPFPLMPLLRSFPSQQLLQDYASLPQIYLALETSSNLSTTQTIQNSLALLHELQTSLQEEGGKGKILWLDCTESLQPAADHKQRVALLSYEWGLKLLDSASSQCAEENAMLSAADYDRKMTIKKQLLLRLPLTDSSTALKNYCRVLQELMSSSSPLGKRFQQSSCLTIDLRIDGEALIQSSC